MGAAKKGANPLISILARDPELSAAYLKPFADPASGSTMDWRDNYQHKGNRCPFDVPPQYQVNQGEAPPKHHQHAGPAEKFPELWRCARANNIPDSVLILSAKRQLEQAPIIQVRLSDTEVGHFLGQVRGDTRYASGARRKIERYCTNLAAVEGTGLFATLTIDPKQCPTSLTVTNQIFYSELKKFKRRLREYASMRYVSVIEAQANGRLHAHVILKFTDQYYRHWVDAHGLWRLDDDALWVRLKTMWPMGSTDVQVIRDGKISGYLAKYVSKGMSIGGLTADAKQGRLSSDERKNYLNMLMPILVHNRMFDASRQLTARPPEERVDRKQQVLDIAAQYVEDESYAEDEIGALVRPLNKVTSFCQGSAYMLSYPLAKAEFAHLVGSIGPPDSPDAINFRSKSICLGCQGCIFSAVKSIYHLQVLRNVPATQAK